MLKSRTIMVISKAVFKKSIKGSDEIMTDPKPQIAFIGRSNSGKSSLINFLLERKNLAKTGRLPGKTKEINFFLINDSFYFVDLPGYGYAKTSLKTRGKLLKMADWYFHQKVSKRKTVLIANAKIGFTEADIETIKFLQDLKEETIIAANKIDLTNQKERSARLKEMAAAFPGIKIIPCSAKTKKGRATLLEEIIN